VKRFRVCDLDKQFPLPPSLQGWLPQDHLTCFIADVTNALNLSAIYCRHSLRGRAGVGQDRLSVRADESGWIIKDDAGRAQYVSISTADKSGMSPVLKARGRSTHSSMPLADNAIFALSRALAKLSAYDTRPKLTASTRQFFLTPAETSEEAMRNALPRSGYERGSEADRGGVSGDQQESAAARDRAQHNRASAAKRGLSRQRDFGIGGGEDQLPNDPGTTAAELIDEVKAVIADPAIEVKRRVRRPGRWCRWCRNLRHRGSCTRRW
jgi:hypothetical protein